MQTNIALKLTLAATTRCRVLAGRLGCTGRRRRSFRGRRTKPKCYVPWTADTKFFKFPAKKGPFRVALANGYIANTWRIQMIQTAKAYAAQPEVAAKLKEFKVVSTGEDVAAQISAINNFIDSGYDAIVVNAQNPKAFAPVIKRAKDAGVVLVAFDNILDTQDAINVNVDQKGLGVLWANWIVKHVPNGGKVLEVRGVAGTSVDTDRHNGIQETLKASGKKWDVVEVVGKWDDATAQKATADAIAVQKKFDAITAQGGDTGVVQAMIDAKHPFVPFGGETENGFRKFCAGNADKGLKCSSAGTGPAQVAVAMKTAIDALEGKVVPQSVKLPLAITEDPNFKDGQDLLFRPIRQFLRRKLLPDLQHQFLRAGNHGANEGKQVRPNACCRTLAARPVSRGGDSSRPAEMENQNPPLFRMEGISKRYGGVRALENADLDVQAGRVHAILGENGAGKSTLIKVMAGVVAPDEGRMLLEGREVIFPDPAAANAAGIVCVFQELSLIPDLSVADNIIVSQSAGPLRPDRPQGAAAPRRGRVGARRRRGHPSDGAGQGSAAVAAAGHRDRQGAGAQAAPSDSR